MGASPHCPVEGWGIPWLLPNDIGGVEMKDDPLQRALAEIRRIEAELLALGDHATLSRYGDPNRGFSIAESLGFRLLTTGEARVVDQLSTMPDALGLVRGYLASVEVPHVSELGGVPERRQGQRTAPPARPDPRATKP